MRTVPAPLRFNPVYRDYIWGGSRFRELYGRLNTPAVCAESWEVSTRPEGMSVVAQGPARGLTLAGLATEYGSDLVGAAAPHPESFPLLIKLIDARERLSIQVHPDEESAALHGGEAKTECWHVLDSVPGAKIFVGFRPGVERSDLLRAIEENRVEGVLEAVPAEPGSTVLVPGGTVHAIGEGCLILEVQQNSNTTYRVYDWGRVDPAGKPRQLHLEKALSVLQWTAPPRDLPHGDRTTESGNRLRILVSCRHFRLERLDLAGRESVINDGRSFHAYFVADGAARVDATNADAADFRRGTSFLMPALSPGYSLSPLETKTVLLRSSLPPDFRPGQRSEAASRRGHRA